MHIPQTLANFAHLLAAAAASHSIQLSPDPSVQVNHHLLFLSVIFSREKKKKNVIRSCLFICDVV